MHAEGFDFDFFFDELVGELLRVRRDDGLECLV